jgi:hypothetical protein
MSNIAPLTETEVRQFVAQWFHALDVHVPLETFLSMIAEDNIEFRFPEVTAKDIPAVTEWYNKVTHAFFDEVHTTKELAITIEGERATVNIVTDWQESNWNAPDPKSERHEFLAGQTWHLKRSAKTGQPVVVDYFVNTFDPVTNTTSSSDKQATNA